MRLLSLAVVALVLAGCNPAPSHDDMAMSAVASADVKSGSGKGVVKAVDLKAGTVTIAHQAIPAVGWGAMTMTFPVSDPALLEGVAAGETVSFDVTVADNKPLITAIRK